MKSEQEFLEDVRKVLESSVHELDAETKDALSQARHTALARRTRRAPFGIRFLPQGAFPAVAVALAMLLLVFWIRPEGAPPTENLNNDLEIISSGESMELYEDLDFYIWFSEEMPLGEQTRGHGSSPAFASLHSSRRWPRADESAMPCRLAENRACRAGCILPGSGTKRVRA